MQHQVVVTGVGIVAANGVGKDDFWAAIKAGRSGIKSIKTFDASRYRCQIAGEVHSPAFDLTSDLDKASKMILAAGEEAMADAGLVNVGHYDPQRSGAVVGTIHSGLLTFEKLHRSIATGKNAEIAPKQLRECALFAPALHLARRFDLRGPRPTVTMACASGTAAIGYAASLVKRGQADVVLAGGVDTVNEFIFSGFYALKALSLTKCRPFALGRDGMVIGEGAAILILENLEHAIARRARIYSQVRGYGMAGDAAHITAPDNEGGGLARAIFSALREANLSGEALDYINAHGVSTHHMDAMESKALEKCLGEAARKIPVSSTKAFTGHAMGAAGAIEAVICLLAMRDSFLPATLNCDYPDPAFNINIMTAPRHQSKINVAMSTSSGFGGQNAAIIFSSPALRARKWMSVGARKQRVAITGIGLVSLLAIGVEEYFNGVSGQENSPASLTLSDIVSARLAEGSSPDEVKSLRQMDNVSRYALLASRLALKDARLDLSTVPSEQVGVVMGTTFGSLESDLQYHQKLISEREPSLVSPMIFRNTSANIAAAWVSIILGIRGVNATIASGLVAGVNAVAYSYDLLQERRAAIILSGSIEGRGLVSAEIPGVARCFNSLGFSDGAAIFAIEKLETALKRQGKIYCEIAGYGMAHSESDVSEALERAMRRALEEAKLRPEQIDCVCRHSSPYLLKEAEAAIRKLFDNRMKVESSPRESPVAWGGFSLANCILAIQRGAGKVISNTIEPNGNCISIVLQDIESVH
jgi:3-oxoacyl-[acyl-carrier-protein] synthase II